jgi:hypothetical protein
VIEVSLEESLEDDDSARLDSPEFTGGVVAIEGQGVEMATMLGDGVSGLLSAMEVERSAIASLSSGYLHSLPWVRHREQLGRSREHPLLAILHSSQTCLRVGPPQLGVERTGAILVRMLGDARDGRNNVMVVK